MDDTETTSKEESAGQEMQIGVAKGQVAVTLCTERFLLSPEMAQDAAEKLVSAARDAADDETIPSPVDKTSSISGVLEDTDDE